MNEWIDGGMKGRIVGWMDGCVVGGWMDKEMDGCVVG